MRSMHRPGTATAGTRPVPERAKIVVFINTSDNEGAELLSGLAAAIKAGNRKVRVLHADGNPETGNGFLEEKVTQANKPQDLLVVFWSIGKDMVSGFGE